MEKIHVTGCSGFIGMHLCRRLLDDGYDVYGIDNMNDHYDLSLKQGRLNLLSSHINFSFQKFDIANLRDVNEAFEKNIFGAPTYVVNKKNFWGQDRFEYALEELNSIS